MITTNNKIRNENPASTGSLALETGFFSTFHLSNTRTNLLRTWFATRFSTKKVERMSQTRTNLSKTWWKTWFAAGYIE